MKKLLTMIAAVSLLAGCCEPPSEDTGEGSEKKMYGECHRHDVVRSVPFKGHEYIVFTSCGNKGLSAIHSPGCGCQGKDSSIANSDY